MKLAKRAHVTWKTFKKSHLLSKAILVMCPNSANNMWKRPHDGDGSSNQSEMNVITSWLIYIDLICSYSVLAKGAQWTALFEAERGLGGEGGPGKPHTGDE